MILFLTILGLAALIGGVVLTAVACIRKSDKEGCFSMRLRNPRPWVIMAVAGLAAFLLAQSIVIVPTGYTGVKTTFGQISDRPVPRGLNFKIPFVDKIELVNNKQQSVVYKDKIWGESAEQIQTYAEGTSVIFQINPEKSAWLYANVTGGTDSLFRGSILPSSVKDAMKPFPAETVTLRSNIEPKVAELLNEALAKLYGEDTVTVLKVTIDQMDFEDAYNQAVAEKAIALKKQEEQAVANQTAIEKAEADKKVAITNAEANAEEARIKAEGNAKARLIQVEAEAEANRKINETTTDVVLRNKFYNAWNGQLPKVMGEGTVITSIEP